VVVRAVVGAAASVAEVLAVVALAVAVEDSAAALVAGEVLAAVALVGVGRPKDLFASIRSTRKRRWLNRQCNKL